MNEQKNEEGRKEQMDITTACISM